MTPKQKFDLEISINEDMTKYVSMMKSHGATYHFAKDILRRLLISFPEDLRDYYEKGKTIKLREICLLVKVDYWENLENSNAIDFIDSAMCSRK